MTKGYCMVSAAPVRADRKDQSEIVSQLLFGELVTIEEIELPWMRISTYSDGYQGYVDHKHIRTLREKEFKRWMDGLSYSTDRIRQLDTPWGPQSIYRGSFVPESETFQIGKDEFRWLEPSKQPYQSAVEYAESYLNTPYLWGGKTPFGIDCSGLVQIIYRFLGYNLPRDAYEQAEVGQTIDFNDIEPGDLAYFENAAGKIIHVGILDGAGGIIHASGHVRRDEITESGIKHSDSGAQTHQLTIIKRL